MDPLWTEGARRALELAAALAAQTERSEIEPLHLLWALMLEESRAAEILHSYQCSTETLEPLAPLGLPEGTPPETRIDLPGDNDTPAIPHGEPFARVLSEAQRLSGLAGRHIEPGSEHLLWGLVAVESPVQKILHQFGLDSDQLSEQISQQTGFTDEPLEVDFHIRWQEQTETDQTDTLRILDAAANRAREGLRVVEDFARFTLDDRHLTERLKTLRHRLAQALQADELHGLTASRETQQDVGTSISTAAELRRKSPLDVLQANFKRVQEAFRTLEEFGKVLSPALGEELGQLRYRLYTLEKAVLTTHASRQRLADKRLYLLATEELCHHGIGPAVRHSLQGGVGIVQVREKTMPDRRLLEHARWIRHWTREAGALMILNDRPDLAVLSDADGVHVGQEELTVREARRIVGPQRLVGVSTHTLEQARQAVLDGADYLGVGPVFPSKTKQFDEFAGLEFVSQVAAEITLPWFAIGGITAENIARVLAAGATRVAVSGEICGAEDPQAAAGRLVERMRSAIQGD